MLVLTGREAHTLPPATVRGLFWRVYARQVWSDDLVTAAHMDLPEPVPLKSRIAKAEAGTQLRTVEAVLFPEDDDG